MVFGLTGIGATALYFLVWWTSLFAVLPFGIESQADRGFVPLGSEPGAPARPALLAKALATTFLATALFVAIGAMLPLAGL